MSQRAELQYLMNDFVVQEQLCNLRCEYCLNFENELKGETPWQPTERVDLADGGAGLDRARRSLARCAEEGDAPLLRISGGEILALPGGVDFVAEAAESWHRVQVLTNGIGLHGETLETLSRIAGLNLCISIDGHTAESNHLRTSNARWAGRILDGLRAALDAGIPVEVYTVLTTANAGDLLSFARWLNDLPRSVDLRLLPFPVRGDAAERFAPGPEALESVESILENAQELRAILPPRAYLERLASFLRNGRRSNRCRGPLSFVQSFDDGTIASCSNCWAAPLGNILEDEGVFDVFGEAPIHRIFLRDPPRFPFCRGCFTPFDVVNVWIDGDCTDEELFGMDLYSSAPAQERMRLLAAAWRDGGAAAVRSRPAGSEQR